MLCGAAGARDVFIAGQAAVRPFPFEPAHTAFVLSPEAPEQAVMRTSAVSAMETEDTIYKSFPKGYDNGLLINRRG